MSNSPRNAIGFLARRMTVDPTGKGIARPVVRIAEGGVAIGVALIIMSLAIVQGFQRDVRELVVGFGAHLRVVAADQGRAQGTDRVAWADVDTAALRAVQGVEHVQAFAQRPAILETREEVEGVVVKGLGDDVDPEFLAKALRDGRLPDWSPGGSAMELLVSGLQARELGLSPGQRVRLLLADARGELRPRVFTVVGVYETGLQEFDGEFVFCALHHLQELSGWGIKARIRVSDPIVGDLPGMREVDVAATGGEGQLRYAWTGVDWWGKGPHMLVGQGEAQVVVSDAEETVSDTAWVTWDDTTGERPQIRLAGGSSDRYIGGLELRVSDYDALWTVSDSVFFVVPYDLDVRSVVDDHPEMFQWLTMLDFNVELIIGLMVLIAILNMASALLLLMLERTRSIGLLKAVGMADGPLMGVFVRLAVRILLRGLAWGNALGFGLALLQRETGLVALDARSYYLSTVPIEIDVVRIATVELGILAVCAIAMFLPARYISRLNPVESLRFD
ncbi:MAG: ABC transporter permease [Flavobacteriales bacterium]|nr:ABC transporter permease [Flavobacteriales bacterium]